MLETSESLFKESFCLLLPQFRFIVVGHWKDFVKKNLGLKTEIFGHQIIFGHINSPVFDVWNLLLHV